MSTINGLPAHVLLVHFVVVLAPLTAILAVLCALWPAVRRRLIWLVLVLAVGVAAVTPLTIEAGEWLIARSGDSPILQTHAERGETMLYFALALLVSVVLLSVVQVRETRGASVNRALSIAVTVVVLAVSVATIVQAYRVGDSGAKATWGGTAAGAPELPDR